MVEERKVGPGAWDIPIPEGAEFGGLSAGTYLSRVSEEPKETLSGDGEPQIQFEFEINDPKHPEYQGRTGRYWCSRKPKAWWNITQTLDALEVPYEVVRDEAGKPKTFRFDPMDCINRSCKTVWEENEYQGRIRTRIRRIISAEETVEELTGGEDSPF